MSTTRRPETYPEPTDFEFSESSDFGKSHADDSSGVVDAVKDQKDRAASALGTAVDKADEQRDRAATGVESAADRIREHADDIPGGEKTTKAAQGAAEQMDKAAGYLRDHDVSSMGDDVVELVKSHPKESIVVALAAGLLLGRALRS
jgi:ElaB/YqjD/DUF883 family membrane-anchored ribosome-binding protein